MPRPSFGCSNCRARRIKCDERQHGCLNCELYGNVCPGYPDRFDVLLRMRTPADTQPLERAHRSRPLTASRNTNQDTASHQEYMRSSNVQVPQQLAYDPDSVALALYYSNNCIDGSTLYSLEQIQAQGSGCLFAAINALSSIDVQRRWSVAGGTTMLTESYHHAIRQLNLALASASEAKMDSTLMAVLIMSAIEMKAAPSATTTYWEAHAQGAAALLQLRGAEQVTSRLGSALFFQASSQLMTVCMLAKRCVPPELHRLRHAVRAYVVDEEHVSWRFHEVMLRLTDFLATERDHNLSPERASTVIVQAHSIYDDVVSIFNNAGPEWQYTRLPSVSYAGLVDYEHIYSTVLATQYWNGYRIALISLCTIALRVNIQSQSQSQSQSQIELPPAVHSFLKSAEATINQTALDTIAAMPQALALLTSKTSSNPSTSRTDICDRGSTHHRPVFHETDPTAVHVLPHVHGCMIQWSVYFAAQSEYVEPRIRAHLVGILDHAGTTTQMRQWRVLAEKLRPVVQYSTV